MRDSDRDRGRERRDAHARHIDPKPEILISLNLEKRPHYFTNPKTTE